MANGGDYVLVFDDNMLKLAKMQETLLKVTADNRKENLEKYKDIVMEIDKQAFLCLLDELEQVNEHNQTLEDELQFLLVVSDYYNQLYELQLGFRKVCELYDGNELVLSDLSQVNIDYINSRKSIIEGYLINLKNIEINKKKLEKLNNDLINEEKNRILLSKRLLEYEDILRKNFINSEGRIVVDGKLQYVSVVFEYKNLDYDFKLLLDNRDILNELLDVVGNERLEIDEKYRTAEICYNSNPNSNSKYILDDISKEFFKVRYRLTMLKILELLSCNYDSYEQFREKREKLLDLVKYRVICLKNLGEHISIDPFARTKIEEQLNVTSSFIDNSKKINKIKKEISELSKLIDDEIAQNRDYRIEIDENEDLIIDTVSMSDMASLIDVPNSIYFEGQRVADNQVVSIKDITDNFNSSKVRQKTNSVIKRVNQMMTVSDDVKMEKKIEIVSPELVIVNQSSNILDNFSVQNVQMIDEDTNNDILGVSLLGSVLLPEVKVEDNIENILDEEDSIKKEDIVKIEDNNSNNIISNNYNSSIFETINPFEPLPLFDDRSDDTISDDVVDSNDKMQEAELESFKENDSKEENDISDVFWVTQSDSTNKLDNNNEVSLSFDEQINVLLADEENSKTKKLVA